jgi:hypothetical protein
LGSAWDDNGWLHVELGSRWDVGTSHAEGSPRIARIP